VKLRDALRLYEGQTLTDGAQEWDVENYFEANINEDGGEQWLDQKVYADENGIYPYRGDHIDFTRPILTIRR